MCRGFNLSFRTAFDILRRYCPEQHFQDVEGWRNIAELVEVPHPYSCPGHLTFLVAIAVNNANGGGHHGNQKVDKDEEIYQLVHRPNDLATES